MFIFIVGLAIAALGHVRCGESVEYQQYYDNVFFELYYVT